MAALTQLLDAAAAGDPTAAAELFPLVYDELRKLAAVRMAAEQPGQTLQATALVHEAYVRLVGSDPDRPWNSRGHFFAAAGKAMRDILVERARSKGRLKRGGGRRRVDLDHLPDPSAAPDDDLLDLSDALDRLAIEYPRCASLVQLRFFAGLTNDEAATVLGIASRTADREWEFARSWLLDALEAD